VDVAEFPGQEDAHEQQDREADAKRQRVRHAVLALAFVTTALEHEEQRGAQAADDGDEGNDHQVFHGSDYPVSATQRSRRFWLLTLAAAAGVALPLRLGVWQW